MLKAFLPHGGSDETSLAATRTLVDDCAIGIKTNHEMQGFFATTKGASGDTTVVVSIIVSLLKCWPL
jgi:hypothetical protein